MSAKQDFGHLQKHLIVFCYTDTVPLFFFPIDKDIVYIFKTYQSNNNVTSEWLFSYNKHKC